MANKLNQLNCLQTAGNTGVGSCFLDFKNIIGAILTPKGWEVDVTALQTNLLAATHHVNKAQRIYPIYGFESTTDSSEQKTIQTLGNGAKHVVREGYNDWTFEYVSGGLSLLSKLRLFNGSAFDFLFIDADMKILGIQGSTATKLKAIPSNGGFFWANPWKLNDASKITQYMVQFVFPIRYVNDPGLVSFINAGFDLPSTINGLQDVNLSGVADATSGSYDITALTAATQTNLGDVYDVTLASAALWVANNTATGLPILINSVAYNATAKTYVLALSKVDANYPTGAGATITFSLAAPATLQGAGVDGYETAVTVAIVKN